MLERLTEDRLAGLGASASEARHYPSAKVEVGADDLARLVAEVRDHRTDARAGATAFTDFHDWLAEWSHGEAGAKAAHQAWYDSMQRQHRDVSRHLARWEILEAKDQALHQLIAQAFVNAALASIGEEGGAHG